MVVFDHSHFETPTPILLRKVVLLFSALSLLIFPAAVRAEAQGEQAPLTIQETLRYVFHENSSIVSTRYSLKAVSEGYEQALAGWRPTVGAETSVFSSRIESSNFSEGDGATTKSASINLEQPLFRGFRTTAETRAAQERIEAERSRLEQTEQDVFLSAVEAYMDVIRDRMLLTLQRANVELLVSERESVTARFEAGDVTRTDVRQTEARFADAQADDAIAESRMLSSEAAFEQVAGFAAPDLMVFPVIEFVFPNTEVELIETAALNNPALRRARAELSAAKSDVKIVDSDFYPQLSAFANHVQEYDPQPGIVEDSNSSIIGVRARMSLYQGGSTISRVREAKNRASQRFSEIREIEQSVRADILSNWKRLQAFDAEIAARELETEAARASAQGVREEARLGERTVLDTLEADQDVLDAESQLVAARRDRVVVAYRLMAALGLLTPRQLGFGPEIPLPPTD